MIGIVVNDMERSVAFYRALGLEIPDGDGGPYHEVTLDGGVRLSWNHIDMVKQIDPDWTAPTGYRMGLAFLCDSVADVDARFESVIAAGFESHKQPWDAFWGQRYAQVLDPDGNIVDMFAPLPTE